MGASQSRPRYDSNHGGNRQWNSYGRPGFGYGQQGMFQQQQPYGAMPQPMPDPMVMTPMTQLSGQPVNEEMQRAIEQAQQYARNQPGAIQPGAPAGMPMPQPQIPIQGQPPLFAQAPPQPQPEIPIRFSPVPPEAQYPRAMSRAPTYISDSSDDDGEPRQGHRRRHRHRTRDIPRDGGLADGYREGGGAVPLPPAPRPGPPLRNPLPPPPKDVYLKKRYRELLPQQAYEDRYQQVYPEGWFGEEGSGERSGLGRALSKLNPFRRRHGSSSYGHRRNATAPTLPILPEFVQRDAEVGDSEGSSSTYDDQFVEPERPLRRSRRDRAVSEAAMQPMPQQPFAQPTPQLVAQPPLFVPQPSPQPQPANPLGGSDLPPGFMPATPFVGGPSPNLGIQPQPGVPLSPDNRPIVPGQPITPMAQPQSMPTPRMPMSPNPMGATGQPAPAIPLSPPDHAQPMPGQRLSPRPSQFNAPRTPGPVSAMPPSPMPMPSPFRPGFTPGPAPARALSPDTPSRHPRRYPTTPGPAPAMTMPEPTMPFSPTVGMSIPPLVAGQGPPAMTPMQQARSMTMPSPRVGGGMAPGQLLRFNANTPGYNQLCHLTPANIAFGGVYWPTAAHLFEAFKFLRDRPDLAERVRQTHDFPTLGGLLAELEPYVRPDWEDVILEKMEEALYQKIIQNQDLVDLLLSTGMNAIIFDEGNDPFWGSGQYDEGANELGKALMRIRERVRWKEMQ